MKTQINVLMTGSITTDQRKLIIPGLSHSKSYSDQVSPAPKNIIQK